MASDWARKIFPTPVRARELLRTVEPPLARVSPGTAQERERGRGDFPSVSKGTAVPFGDLPGGRKRADQPILERQLVDHPRAVNALGVNEILRAKNEDGLDVVGRPCWRSVRATAAIAHPRAQARS